MIKRFKCEKKFISRGILFLVFAGVTLAGCGSNLSSKVDANNEENIRLKDYFNWTPVLKGDKAFPSAGHGGITVKSYINPIAKNHLDNSENPFPLPEGSELAKAVISAEGTSSKDATRVYFMRKEKAGFDSANGDWSYALATRVNGALVVDPSVKPREALCVSCHSKFAEFDYVKTIDIYKKQKPM